MTESNHSPPIPIREFVGVKQSNLFQTLKHPQFTGQLILSSSKQEEWTFYLYLGRIIYATGGTHTVRRWLRNVKRFTPGLIQELTNVNPELLANEQFQQYWEYELLNYWLQQGMVTRQHLTQIIRNIVKEVLFDVTQRMEIVFQLSNEKHLSTQLVFINPDQIISEVSIIWDRWQEAKLADRFPNNCPVIFQAEQLQQKTSPKSYELMSKLFNGQNTLRDLSLKLNKDIVYITKSMLPYIQIGFIDLIKVADLPCPLNFPQ